MRVLLGKQKDALYPKLNQSMPYLLSCKATKMTTLEKWPHLSQWLSIHSSWMQVLLGKQKDAEAPNQTHAARPTEQGLIRPDVIQALKRISAAAHAADSTGVVGVESTRLAVASAVLMLPESDFMVRVLFAWCFLICIWALLEQLVRSCQLPCFLVQSSWGCSLWCSCCCTNLTLWCSLLGLARIIYLLYILLNPCKKTP